MKIGFFIATCFTVFSMYMISRYGLSSKRGDFWLVSASLGWLVMVGIRLFGFC